MLERDVVAVHVADFAETSPECVNKVRGDLNAGDDSNNWHRRLLRPRLERPRRRAAKQRDECAPLHSITSSARASSVEGTVRPMILAVVRFMTKSNLVGCSTGRSAGFAPRKILSTYAADRRNMSEKLGPYDIRPPASTNLPLS